MMHRATPLTHRAPRVTLAPNLEKIITAIGFLIKEGEVRCMSLTQYDIVKAIFIADRSHLNKFGRPITYDNYVAMRHGPVPSLSYDLLKKNQFIMHKYGMTSLPWAMTPADHIGHGCYIFSESRTVGEERVLSPSDINCLRNGLAIISGLTFGQVRDLTHGDQAYKEAWGDGESQNAPMSLGLLFDTPDFDLASEIEFVSKMACDSERVTDDDVDAYFNSIEAR